ncbi:MAG: leucine--tRNA ligase [Candidatus Promineifilaceae bacterium]
MKKENNKETERYNFRAVEEQWRAYWDEIDLYRTGDDPEKENIYILDFFPYPSGAGLSVGHCRNYIPTCVSSRFHRMRGFNVLHPMGWDAFGLPAENYAIDHGIHPRESSAEFSATYRRQMKLIACSYDWSREFSSTDPDYYRWTQWFFLLLYKRGLAYRALSSQWWCPECQTILANEQVENGRCWRCDSEVVTKELEQWHLRITQYADRLLDDLELIDWPEAIKKIQSNWIGRSEGLEVSFVLQSEDGAQADALRVFTTRPDTLYGATFLALAPEHPQAAAIAAPEYTNEIKAFIERARNTGERARSAESREMAGRFTGRYAVHPLTGEAVPIWIADYVLPGYGTGAIMAVPAHDDRDYAFAMVHNLPIVEVVRSQDTPIDGCYTGQGILANSGPYSGLESQAGGEQMAAVLVDRGLADWKINYKIRDWLISRQRYWGAPIPMIHCAKCGIVPVPESDLPLLLPDTMDFAPTGNGRSPLARIDEWVNTTCPECGGPAKRETDTMDGFACSSWYFLRFASPHYDEGPFEPQAVHDWLPVDTYVGGAEHAVMHLLYARFWTKVLYDAGLIDFVEPFSRLLNQGVLHSGVDGRRMSKSKGNVVTPDEVVAAHGTDALRLYILFLGPFDADVVWEDRGIKGISRFLDRFWRLTAGPKKEVPAPGAGVAAFERRRQQVIKQVTEDMIRYRYNTALAALMEYLNYLNKVAKVEISDGEWRRAMETLTLLLSPMAPFITEEVWQNVLGYPDSVHRQPWPEYDEAKAKATVVTIVVQVNGRVRDRVQAEAGASEESLRELALDSTAVRHSLAEKRISRIIIVPDRLVNIVI